MVSKEHKVTGKRQTWALRVQRAGASATVWDRVPGTWTYFKAADAMAAADQQFPVGPWHKNTGRGNAYYTAKSA